MSCFVPLVSLSFVLFLIRPSPPTSAPYTRFDQPNAPPPSYAESQGQAAGDESPPSRPQGGGPQVTSRLPPPLFVPPIRISPVRPRPDSQVIVIQPSSRPAQDWPCSGRVIKNTVMLILSIVSTPVEHLLLIHKEHQSVIRLGYNSARSRLSPSLLITSLVFCYI